MDDGYVKLWRKVVDWEWFSTPHMFHVLFYLIAKSQHKQTNYRGLKIERGQCLFGFRKASSDLGISVRSLRTCIMRLKSTHELTQKSTHQGTIITISNYSRYQIKQDKNDTQNDTQNDIGATHDRHTTDTIQECKEYKNKRNIYICDEDFLKSLKQLPRLKGVDVDGELGKMDIWLTAHPTRKKTRRFITNWLIRASQNLYGQQEVRTSERVPKPFPAKYRGGYTNTQENGANVPDLSEPSEF